MLIPSTPCILKSHYSVIARRNQKRGNNNIPDFAFAFDIDGVLVRSSTPIPGASETLQYLQRNLIPFILLTNGGGKHESERAANLSSRLSVDLDPSMLVQSHTPFADMVHDHSTSLATSAAATAATGGVTREGKRAGEAGEGLQDKTILVCGGDHDRCRQVAERYGFRNVVVPGDIFTAHPEIWPFSRNFARDYYAPFARPLPRPINPQKPEESLKIDAVFVYNDPRDWGLDIQLILDVLLSSRGVLGTYSEKNGDKGLPNQGYLQDGQPMVYFSNPDLLWANSWNMSRLGQGGFREALEGVWSAVTGGEREGVSWWGNVKVIGKPFRETYDFAEDRLVLCRDGLVEKYGGTAGELKRVYMVGDNPESDIRGANTFDSPRGVEWISLLTRTGVFKDRPGEAPSWKPRQIVNDVKAAVQYALNDSGWKEEIK